MKTFKMLLLISVVVTVLVTVPCRNVECSEVVVDKWEVPFINAWTGVAAGYGILCDFFQKTAVEEINASGGIAGKPLVMLDLDSAMDPTRGASRMKRAVENSLVIIGPMTSLVAQVATPIAAKEGVMCIAAAAGAETIKDSRPWAVVLMVPNDKRAIFTMNAWLDRNPEIKSVVMLGLPTVAQWARLGELQKEALEKRGVNVIDNIAVEAGAVDISSVVIRALRSRPDGIVTRLMPADTVRVISELGKRGFKKNAGIFIHSSADSPELYTMAREAGNILDGTYIGLWGAAKGEPAYEELLAKFRTVKGQENATSTMWGDLFYVATYMVKEAIEQTGATGDPAKLKEERIKIKDYINSMKNFDSRIKGAISALPDGTFTVPAFIGRVENNKAVVVMSSTEYFKE